MWSFAGQSLATLSSPSATAGGTVRIQSAVPASFTLRGVGTLTVTGPSSATFTAPGYISSGHVLNGCMVLPSDTVFNTRIDTLPVASTSATELPYIAVNWLSIAFQWGTNVVTNQAATSVQKFYYTPELNGIAFPIPAQVDMKREQGAFTTDGNNDHHLFIVNRDSCTFYETYQQFSGACVGCTAQSGWTYSSTTYDQPSGGTTDAAGLPLGPLTIHLSEIKAGAIQHALRFTGCAGCISNQSIWPATGSTGAQPGAPPMGARFRLRSTYDVSRFPPAAQIVLRALQQYGMFLADIGTTGTISASSDVTEDSVVASQLQSIWTAGITLSDFDIVDESSLELSPASNAVNPNNSYVQPMDQALVTVSASSESVDIPIALVPVTVGTTDPAITVQAGTSPFIIPGWVNGTPEKDLIWSISPEVGAGSIDNSGLYTPPATLTTVSQAVITASSVVDPSASMTIAVTLLPSGSINIDSGSTSQTVDSYGSTWLADAGFETGSYAVINDSWPSNAWGTITDLKQFQTYMYNWGDDLEYRLHVPNGSYVVTFLFGIGQCKGTFGTSWFDNGLINGPLDFQVQERLVLTNYDPGIGINHACRTPAYITLPATVTDTGLRLNLRATGGRNTHSVPVINGLQIQPYQGKPYLTVMAQGQETSVPLGTSLQLNAINWFGDPAEPLIWSVADGPGVVDQNGMYTAPSAPTATSVTVQVAGQVSGRQASITLQLGGSGGAVSAPQPFQLSESTVQFGALAIGETAARTVNIVNPSSSSQGIAGLSLSGSPEYSVIGNTCGTTVPAGGSCTVSIQFSPATIGNETAQLSILSAEAGASTQASLQAAGIQSEAAGLQFVPIAPCRVVDTRMGNPGLGGGELSGGEERTFAIAGNQNCHISTAAGYALNITAIPEHSLGYLTIWPTGSTRPTVSTLNSWDGRVKANAMLVAAGSDGSVNAFATDATQLVIDVTGYFVPAGTEGGLDFYPISPCRALDTRADTTGSLLPRSTRNLGIAKSGCDTPGAQAYSVNITAIPHGPLGFLTAWSAGDPMPPTSVLNSWGGSVVANAAIVPAGANGDISLFSSDKTDVIVDVNGYYAPHQPSGLAFFPLTIPCRAFDSRVGGTSTTFQGERTISIANTVCSILPSSRAIALNATAIPIGDLNFLAVGASSGSVPDVSTLNSFDGAVVSNLAVPALDAGSLHVYLSDSSALILDVFGAFAPY